MDNKELMGLGIIALTITVCVLIARMGGDLFNLLNKEVMLVMSGTVVTITLFGHIKELLKKRYESRAKALKKEWKQMKTDLNEFKTEMTHLRKRMAEMQEQIAELYIQQHDNKLR